MTHNTIILVKLNRVLSAIARGDRQQAFSSLLDMITSVFPCDAAVLLRLQGKTMVIEAQHGLVQEAHDMRFELKDHPRLQRIYQSSDWVRFDDHSDLSDPYDHLVESHDGELPVHDCMGTLLRGPDNEAWGALTFDTLEPKAFEQLDPQLLNIITELAGLCLSLEKNLEQLRRSTALLAQPQQDIIGKSIAINALRQSIDAVAATELEVLIQGETGTGKELVAQRIHALSQRKDSVYVTLNCATLPTELADSELFGHEKGAFTGADKMKRGKFELADGGTLFLDEIGEIPIALQAKLLRALQQGEIQRIGSEKTIKIDCRVIAATNRNLLKEVEQGQFREDLYHRLNVYPVICPPLRSRGDDILLLTNYFSEQWQHKIGIQSVHITRDALNKLSTYRWPGNIRELENYIARLLVTKRAKQGDNIIIAAEDIQLTTDTGSSVETDQNKTIARASIMTGMNLREQTEEFQRRIITQALATHEQNWAQAAKSLGIDRANLSRLSKRLGLR